MSAEAVWVGWLALFLIYEIVGAFTEDADKGSIHKDADVLRVTLSRNVYDWFGVKTPRPYGPARRAALLVFMCVLTLHWCFGSPGGNAVIVTAVPPALVIAYAVIFERDRGTSKPKFS